MCSISPSSNLGRKKRAAAVDDVNLSLRPGEVAGRSALRPCAVEQNQRREAVAHRERLAVSQDSEMVVLDESLGALYPQTMKQTMDRVRRHADTLLVIAHP